jgi:hypothetical protein
MRFNWRSLRFRLFKLINNWFIGLQFPLFYHLITLLNESKLFQHLLFIFLQFQRGLKLISRNFLPLLFYLHCSVILLLYFLFQLFSLEFVQSLNPIHLFFFLDFSKNFQTFLVFYNHLLVFFCHENWFFFFLLNCQ